MERFRPFVAVLFVLTFAAGAQAQGTVDTGGGSVGTDRLLILTVSVVVMVFGLLWAASKLTTRKTVPKAPDPDQPGVLSDQQQAIGAFAAFEKAKLMSKKAAQAKAEDVARGSEAGDEHPS